MKNVSLRHLIKNEYLHAIIFPVLLIEVALLVLYFSINSYVGSKNQELLLSEVKTNMNEIMTRESQLINQRLKAISTSAMVLQNDHSHFFETLSSQAFPSTHPEFTMHSDGTYYKSQDNGGSSVIYMNITKIGEKEREKALKTENFDTLYKSIQKSDPNIAAVYLNTYDSMNRLYPFIPDVLKTYEHNMSIPSFNFYYEADATHNPSKKPVWTSAYLDPAGNGWMVSCIAPVYNKGFLEGVIGIDLTIDALIKNVLSLKLPWDAKAILVDKQGMILAMPSSVEELLELKELRSHVYKSTVKQDTIKPEEFNLLKNKKSDIASFFKTLLSSQSATLNQIRLGEKNYLVSSSIISETGWRFIVFVDEDKVYEPIFSLDTLSKNFGYFAMGFMILFYALFLWYIYRRSGCLADSIASPVTHLSESAKQFEQEMVIIQTDDSAIDEIQTLNRSFMTMSQRIEEAYRTLEDKVQEAVGEIRQKDKMLIDQSRQVAMGEMISNIAHHWRQPLNAVGVIIQDIQDASRYNELTPEYIENSVNESLSLIHSMSQTIDNFREFFKPQEGEKSYFTVQEAIDESVNLLKDMLTSAKIQLYYEYHTTIPLYGYSKELSRALLNMLSNAKDAILEKRPPNPMITIAVQEIKRSLEIRISDNGGGIEEAILSKIFDPYFTTKDQGKGSGIGLYMTKTIIENTFLGTIVAFNENDGVTFIVTIPLDKQVD